MFLDIFKKIRLEIVVFLSGSSLMILEIVGSRVLSPYIGTSTAVWTILIGVILGFLSLGYYIGGKYSDNKVNLEILSNILLCSAFSILLLIIINKPLLSFFAENVRLYSFITILFSSVLLFSLPSFLFGLISPYAAKLKLITLKKSGDTIGKLYAISTIGSIVGTFAAGFLLIPFLGTFKTLSLITIILIFTSLIAYCPKFYSKKTLFIFLIFVVLIFQYFANYKLGYIDMDTLYNRIIIKKTINKVTKRSIIYMMTDPLGIQAGIFADIDDNLVLQYLKYFRLDDFFNPNIKQALMIGGGVYSYPKDFLKKHPNAKIDAIEIDPGITQLAKKYFNLADDSRLTIYHEDGRVFLNLNKKKYDSIYIDAFKSRTVPYQLTTREAIEKMFVSLNDGGIVILNLVSSFEGEKSKFFQSTLITYKSVFPHVYVFQANPTINSYEPQNIILIALKKPMNPKLTKVNNELISYLNNLWKEKNISSDTQILTDDSAPDDYFNLNIL